MNSLISGDWLTPDRLRVYPRIFVALYVAIAALWVAFSVDLIDQKGKPLGYDFITFWSAADIALDGHPADAFDHEKLFAYQQKAVPALSDEVVFLWHYPPTFQLLSLPLALVPYLWSYGLFVALTLAVFLATLRLTIDLPPAARPDAWWLLLAFPGVFINIFHGQNAFLTTAVFAGGLLLLESRPVAAGLLIGLLSYKPHFGLLLPFVLLAGGYSRSFAVAAATALASAGLATAVLGLEPWRAFAANLETTRYVLEQGLLPWHKMHSVFAMARLLGAGIPLSYALHGAVALVVAVLTVRAWRFAPPLGLRVALLTVATMILSPYFFDYDLAILALPLGLLAADGLRNGWRPGMRSMLAVVWSIPISAVVLADHAALQLSPPILIALFAMIHARIAAEGSTNPRRSVLSAA